MTERAFNSKLPDGAKIRIPEEEKQYVPKHRVNIANNPKSPVTTKGPEITQDEYENRVSKFVEEQINTKDNFVARISEFVKIVNSKELYANKTEIDRKREIGVAQEVLRIAKEFNQDEKNEMDTGTMPVIMMFFKLFLQMRDRINELEYKLKQMSAEPPKEL